MLETPVLLLLYNRPDLTRRLLDRVRRLEPRRLFVVADGPRAVPGDRERCEEVRRLVGEVDWAGSVERDFAEGNLGCRRRVASGLDWFFRQVERGIILEDDCLPHESFFPFCERMLERFEDDDRVMHVAGANFQDGRRRGDGSYYFSIYPTIWGWASWRRAWRHYDEALSGFPEFLRERRLETLLPARRDRAFWSDTLERTFRGEIDTWDHAWTFALWQRGGVAVVPDVNLVENVGARDDGTHMRGRGRPPLLDPGGIDVDRIVHPRETAVDADADRRTLAAFLRFFPLRSRLRLWWLAMRGGTG